eukprot:scaffold13676_cov30-Tisochrysis_lutea.AAC.3
MVALGHDKGQPLGNPSHNDWSVLPDRCCVLCMCKVIAQVLEAPEPPEDFAVITEKGEPPSVEQLQAQLAAL